MCVVQPCVPVADFQQPASCVRSAGQIDPNGDWYQQQQRQRPILLVQDKQINLPTLLQRLRDEYHVQDVLVEAGTGVTTAFLQARLVDEWIIYQAPCLLGYTALPMTQLDFSQMSQQYRFHLVSLRNHR